MPPSYIVIYFLGLNLMNKKTNKFTNERRSEWTNESRFLYKLTDITLGNKGWQKSSLFTFIFGVSIESNTSLLLFKSMKVKNDKKSLTRRQANIFLFSLKRISPLVSVLSSVIFIQSPKIQLLYDMILKSSHLNIWMRQTRI